MSKNSPVISIEMPDTCDSENSQFTENGVTCYTREFKGENINIETAVTVSLKEIETNKSDDCSISRYCVSVCTNFDSSNHTKKALEMASGCDYETDKTKTREKWQKFFNSSKVTLKDKKIEKSVPKYQICDTMIDRNR